MVDNDERRRVEEEAERKRAAEERARRERERADTVDRTTQSEPETPGPE